MAFEALVKELETVDPRIAVEILKNEALAARIEDWRLNGLRQSDFSRQSNLKSAEIAAEKQRLAEQATSLETERARMNEQFLGAQQEREKAELALAAARGKATTASKVYGVDLDTEIFGDPQPSPPKTQTARQDRADTTTATPALTKRVEDIEHLFDSVPNLTVELQQIAIDHARLFPDQPLDLRQIMDEAVTLRKNPMFVWDNKFGATIKRAEIERDKYRKEGADAERDRQQQQAGRKSAAPFGQIAAKFPLFDALAHKQSNAPADRAKREDETVAAAVAAFQSGKYAPVNRREQ